MKTFHSQHRNDTFSALCGKIFLLIFQITYLHYKPSTGQAINSIITENSRLHRTRQIAVHARQFARSFGNTVSTREGHRGEKSCLVRMWSIGMWSLFTRAENHITVQLCARLYVHALPCVLFIWSADMGCINLGCLRICGQTTPDTTSGKRPRTHGEHLSLSDASTQCH